MYHIAYSNFPYLLSVQIRPRFNSTSLAADIRLGDVLGGPGGRLSCGRNGGRSQQYYQDSLQNCRSSVRFGSAHKIHFLEVKEMFMQSLENHLNECNDRSVTENGAVGYKSTGKALLDLNFLTSSLRSANEQTIIRKFDSAFQENPELALK